MIVGYDISSLVVYHRVDSPSSSDVLSVVASVRRATECHMLVNTFSSKLDSKGHLLSPHVRRFGRQRTQ